MDKKNWLETLLEKIEDLPRIVYIVGFSLMLISPTFNMVIEPILDKYMNQELNIKKIEIEASELKETQEKRQILLENIYYIVNSYHEDISTFSLNYKTNSYKEIEYSVQSLKDNMDSLGTPNYCQNLEEIQLLISNFLSTIQQYSSNATISEQWALTNGALQLYILLKSFYISNEHMNISSRYRNNFSSSYKINKKKIYLQDDINKLHQRILQLDVLDNSIEPETTD